MHNKNDANPINTSVEKYEGLNRFDENRKLLVEKYRRKERRWYTIITIISAVLVLIIVAFAIAAFWG